jgi:hypothetical protein
MRKKFYKVQYAMKQSVIVYDRKSSIIRDLKFAQKHYDEQMSDYTVTEITLDNIHTLTDYEKTELIQKAIRHLY